jgi:hypothetical protein
VHNCSITVTYFRIASPFSITGYMEAVTYRGDGLCGQHFHSCDETDT